MNDTSAVVLGEITDPQPNEDLMAEYMKSARAARISGGKPYILITAPDPGGQEVAIEVLGFAEDKIALALREVADLIDAEV